MLLGRDRERQDIDAVLHQARAGHSTALALVGEPGIGKTALLEYAGAQATGMQILRARGIESEASIPFASLLELLRPALGLLELIPEPQGAALAGALALAPGRAQERFAVGAATLSLLAAYAERTPVAVLIDDAHWLDPSSAQALLFAIRRLVADPVAVLIAVRQEEPSLLDGADLPRLVLGGLTNQEAAALLDGLPATTAERLYEATAGNPLALVELAGDVDGLSLAPAGAPVLVPAKISRTFAARLDTLDEPCRRAVVLAATSDSGDLALLGRAAGRLDVQLGALSGAETAGLIDLREGTLEFRHPLARSAVYAAATPEQRRAAHRALADSLPDRDIDRRAWHLAAAAVGVDESSSAALAQAAARARDRSAYATAAAAFDCAARLQPESEHRARLLLSAAEAAWDAGYVDRAAGLLAQARAASGDSAALVEIEHLSGRIAIRQGPIMRGYAILTAAARRAQPEVAVTLLAEAAGACFYAGQVAEMVSVAERARAQVPAGATLPARFLAATAVGMARILGGDAAAGAEALQEAVALAERSPQLGLDLHLLPWLAIGPIFLRERARGRSLLEQALQTARARSAISALPFVLNLIARDQATSDRWAVAEANYREGIELARESEQHTDLAFGLAGLAWLEARRGRDAECRACAIESLALSARLGTRLLEVWSTAALGELELARGEPMLAAAQFERQRELLRELAITDVDLWPGPELVDAYLRAGRSEDADAVAAEFIAAASAKGQPWSLARAQRCQGMLDGDGALAGRSFERALALHERTPDGFEEARTRLAYGERLRRERNRVLARGQLRAAADGFDRLGAAPWAERARHELAATGVTVRRRDPSTIDELTPQELQIALLLAGGKTTREAAGTLFLSPKTIEYHLRHIYVKLGIHSREELAAKLAAPAGYGE